MDFPLPTIGVRGGWKFADHWRVTGFAQFLKLKIGDYDGSLVNASTGVEWAFHPNFYVGAQLTVPLFGFGRAYGENLTAKSVQHQAEAGFSLTERGALADTRNAQLTLATAEAQWRATAGTVEVAQRTYDIASVRFEEGVSTQSELADARILLQQAQANRAQAARDLQLARIRLALLPALPLSGSP